MIDGDDLRAMRINAGISQQGMSKKLKCDRKTIHNYEIGVSDIPSSRLFQWLTFCKLDLSILLNQVKAVRGEASKNGQSKLLDIMSVILLFSPLWSHLIVTPLYLLLLGVCAAYGVYKKDINVTHIAGFIFILTAVNYPIFDSGLINYVTPSDNKLLQGTIIYGTQLILSIITVFVLIFRVQLSRLISKSNNIALTHFDGIFHWLYIYASLIYLLGLLENIAWSHFELKSWTLIYDNFEGLIYIGWALCCGALLAMMISSTGSNCCNDKKTTGNE
ncbi:helix-turn-helix transcriptional regulator [Pseudoalteromonas sp. MMG013]|uniref:helix-turn-helix domain-containing protein n=1 Tax=Pseudoalteromonas sp. MMG013 TaxID=2822687 RepID=UPI001B370029|nr:helix-turn-helix transcriptional regulator [Pseudoalteromonas sp. MMG013]MBQ4862688.1 helix-turn-helix transcriptional regulator [Pseudoalteromonas sp. MMG013]